MFQRSSALRALYFVLGRVVLTASSSLRRGLPSSRLLLVARAAQGGQAHGMVNKWAAAAGQVGDRATTIHDRPPQAANHCRPPQISCSPSISQPPTFLFQARRAEATASHSLGTPMSLFSKCLQPAKAASPRLACHCISKFPVVCFVLLQEDRRNEAIPIILL